MRAIGSRLYRYILSRSTPVSVPLLRLRRGPMPRHMLEELDSRLLFAATHLAFGTAPGGGFVGITETPAITVKIEDGANAVVTGDHSKVTLVVASGPAGGKILGVFTVDAVAGVATFNNIHFNKAGSYTLQALDNALTPVTSSAFTIQAAPVASSVTFVTQPGNNTAGSTINTAVVVNVLDQYGHIFTTGHPTISLKLSNPPAGGKLLGKIKVTASNGVATFTGVALNQAGNYQLEAVDGAMNHTSSSFTVAAPVHADAIVFSTQPASNNAGSTIAPVVRVLDQYGNLFTAGHPTLSLHLQSGPADGKLLGTLKVAAVNGIATFSGLSLSKAGTYTLQAVDGAFTVNSGAFTVTAPSVASSLAFFVQPTNFTAGNKMATPVAVKVFDQYGHFMANDHSQVTITVSGGQGTFTANAQNGIATFAGIGFTKAGSYTLQATGTSLTPAISNPFAVIAGAATHLAFAQVPAANAAHAGPFAIKVDLLDKFGNIATSTANVTLTSTGPAGSTPLNLTLHAIAGTATFANVAFSAAGIYHLKATSAGVTLANSSSIVLT